MAGYVNFSSEYLKNASTDGSCVAALGLNEQRITSETNPYSEAEYIALMDSISPLAFDKRGDAVPSVMAQAMLVETLIDRYNGVSLEEALKQYEIPAELYLLPNSGYATGCYPTINRAHNALVKDYLKTYFGY